MCSKNLTNKKQKIFSEKQKGFRYGLSYSTPQQSEETRGNAITQPRSHSITLGQQPLIQTAKNFTATLCCVDILQLLLCVKLLVMRQADIQPGVGSVERGRSSSDVTVDRLILQTP